MSSLISVIVPVYNTERYLDKCIKSILNQTYQNLEVILVDDGSTDGSSEKCDWYAQKDHRIRVIHKQNGGQSSARNSALDVCTGDYIAFVDSDDWIEPDMYLVLLDQLKNYGANLAVSGRYDVYEHSGEKIIGKRLGKSGIFDSDEVLPQMAVGRLSDFSVCDKLFGKDLWEVIRFPEGEIYEDFAVMYKVLISAKKVVLYDEPFYVYFHRGNSTVTSDFREALTDYPKQTKQFLLDIMLCYPEHIDYAVWAHIKAIQFVLIKLLRSNRTTYRAYGNLYKEYIQDINQYSVVWRSSPLFSTVDRLICEVLRYKSIARWLFLLKTVLTTCK